jgi:hypothetical protein
MHWLGSDVTYALAAARSGRASARLQRRPVHWAEVDWTASELEPLGISADLVPLTSTRMDFNIVPFPETFTVLTYLPEGRPEFYGQEIVANLASALPGVRFLVAGNAGEARPTADNIAYLGWVPEMRDVYARSNVLLRMPIHDGLSFMVLEALACGRYVIWNHPLAGVIEAHSGDEALASLRLLADEHQSGKLQPNVPGRDFVQKTLSPEAVRSEILSRFAAIIEHGSDQVPSTPERRNAATSDSE